MINRDLGANSDQNKAFFDLPLQQKLAISNIEGPEPQRGYSAIGVEKTATLNIDGAVNLDMASHEGREDIKVCGV